jgi:hypothetical protein
MTVTLPLFLIPAALTAALYLFCGYQAASGYGLTGMLDGIVWGVLWIIGTLLIWLVWLVLMVTGVI